MEAVCWPSSHCDALKEFLKEGMSYREATNAVNARFGTVYSRSAVLGRALRMRLAHAGESKSELKAGSTPIPAIAARTADVIGLLMLWRSRPAFLKPDRVRLRCVEVVPRHLELADLEVGDCRYPYGGDEDGEAITFCGNPCRNGSSYCAPHFHLTRNPDFPAERSQTGARPRVISLVEMESKGSG